MTPAARGEDPRTRRTRERLRDALLAECAELSLEDLSVAQVVRRAEVGRATFYLHYEDLQALAADACGEVVREAVDAVHDFEGAPDPAEPPPALTVFLASVAERADLYRRFLQPGGGGPLGEVLHRELKARAELERRRAGVPYSPLAGSAVSAVFTGVFADWLHGVVDVEPGDFAAQVWRLVISVHGIFGRSGAQ